MDSSGVPSSEPPKALRGRALYERLVTLDPSLASAPISWRDAPSVRTLPPPMHPVAVTDDAVEDAPRSLRGDALEEVLDAIRTQPPASGVRARLS